jgi:diguanylate cyclase (GGDEF)-like protein
MPSAILSPVEPGPNAKRILIVEDERIIALDLRAALEELGYRVVGTASTSDDAMAKAAQFQPDLTLMDIRIKGSVDGIQTAAQLKARYSMPVVYLTANADHATLRRALETVPAGYLAKPYSPRSLHTTIQVALRRQDAERELIEAHTQERRRFQMQSSELLALIEHLTTEAYTDSLTGLHNRRFLEELLGKQLAVAERGGHALGVILVDLDHFKQLTDTHGHVEGDNVLRAVAAYLLRHVRQGDVACRYGGEQFALVAAGASLVDTLRLAERLRAELCLHSIEIGSGQRLTISASMGVSAFPEHGLEPERLLSAADGALYRAKLSGRDRVVPAPI